MLKTCSFPLEIATPDLVAQADQLMADFGFVLDETRCSPRLHLSVEHLALCADGFSPLWVDFQDRKWTRRCQVGKQQGLVKACQPQKYRRIIDATAGWGRDAIILASLGADVLMLERHPVMAALLQNGLTRFQPHDQCGQLSLIYGQAHDYFKHLDDDYPDVVYIDPMHPARQKSALVKKDMQVLQQLIGPDQDVLSLIELARRCVKHRVVVKWPEHQPAVLKPDASIHGKTVRFDLYHSG